jgi:hypothetical protein
MAEQDRAEKLILDAYEQTTKGRGKFEELDQEATEAAVRILKSAADLAEQRPEEFFGLSTTPVAASPAPATNPGGAQEGTDFLGPVGKVISAIEKIGELLDFLKCEKEYWGGRDDTGADGAKDQSSSRVRDPNQ